MIRKIMQTDKDEYIFERIASALERISPPTVKNVDLNEAEGFVYEAKKQFLKPVNKINRIPIDLLKGLEPQKDLLLKNQKLLD